MRLFVDTEYTNEHNPKLISIGIVTEDGKQDFYQQSSCFSLVECSSFTTENILPLLEPSYSMPEDELSKKLKQWFREQPRRVTLASDSILDIKFILILIGEQPNVSDHWLNLRGMIDTTVYHNAVCKYHAREQNPWHHALHDARAHRLGWLAWSNENKHNLLCIESNFCISLVHSSS
ncbi:TPA: hypothetical protein ACV1O4_002732 [Yersinia enterocolitica]|nr:3'-5' exoribonuclease [Yersinia enterocolitica]HDL6660565.1 3'-5' exoribonuclease [Yersinia enterocolitica]HDL6664053.1 3'-5' exoribonuclease [Yersinia enterocolitica]HDL6712391.1 3'-5' exoribonuclease [Yersinia enterocolitica]HDL6754648.1 3'-5' exoribonuclease [Yersinia enterocolitica]